MAQETKTLAQVAEEIESGNVYYSKTRIRMGHFESFADFMSYFDAHYKPMLLRMQQEGQKEKLMNFFIDDMLSIFGE